MCVQLVSSDKQMSLRRSLSDISRLEMRVQSVESENKRLKDELEQLKGAQAREGVVAEVRAAIDAQVTLSEFLLRESRPHPASAPKKVKRVRVSKKGHLKGIAPGQLLTQPHIIQGIKEHEAQEREKAARKEAAKAELREMKKRARAEMAAEKKRKKAEGAAPARRVRRKREVAVRVEEEVEEKGREEEGVPDIEETKTVGGSWLSRMFYRV